MRFQPEYAYTCYIISRTLPNLSYCWTRLPEASITPIQSCGAWKGNSIIWSQAVNCLSFFHPISARVLHTRHVSWRFTFLVQWYLKIVYSVLATKVINDDRSWYCMLWRRREYCLLWVLKRAVSMRWFFWAPKTCVKNNLLKIFTSLC